MSGPVLTLAGVRKAFRRVPAVAGVDLEVGSGELVGLIGENGAGKTTTIRAVMGEVRPDAGDVTIAGSTDPTARRRVGYVSQDAGMYPDLTGRENLHFVATARDMPRGARGPGVDEALLLAGLGEASDRLVREYSGGMRQRLALAGAFLGDPALVVLDEAFQGLDPGAMLRFRDRLQDHARAGGGGLVCSLNLELLSRICGRVLLMAAGRIEREIPGGDLAALEACFGAHDAPTAATGGGSGSTGT